MVLFLALLCVSMNVEWEIRWGGYVRNKVILKINKYIWYILLGNFYSEQPFLLHENIHAFKLTKDLLNLMGSCIGISEYLFTCKSMLTE